MSQFGAIYISFEERAIKRVEEVSETIKQKGFLFTVRFYHEKPWIQLHVEEPENVSYYAQEVSKIFPDRRVVGLAAYTVTDSTIFCEFQAGEVLRLLQSGFQQEQLWEKIEGNSQSWESEILAGRIMKLDSPGMTSYDIQKIGMLFELPGFGVPKHGEAWSKEIYN